MSKGDDLEEYFRQFPGIGARQAKRFVYFLLTQRNGFAKELAGLISSLKEDVKQCTECFRFFSNGVNPVCSLCGDKREESSLLIVEKDADLETVEKSGAYKGKYFSLGGVVPILEKDPANKIRIRELVSRVERDGKAEILKEVILAFSLTAEGDNTAQYVKKTLEPLTVKYGLKITTLGRGFSTGLELEYSDADTLKNALQNRG